MKSTITSEAVINDAKWYLDWSKKRMALTKKSAKTIDATIDLFNRRMDGIGADDSGFHIWPSVNPVDGTVILTASIDITTDSLIEGIIPQILKAMLDMECDPVASTDNVSSLSASRVYKFKRLASGPFLAVDVTVTATIQETDTGTCRKVQIGTEMVEVATYKLECQGE